MNEINGFTLVGIVTLAAFAVIVFAIIGGIDAVRWIIGRLSRSNNKWNPLIEGVIPHSLIKQRWIVSNGMTYCTVHERHFSQLEEPCWLCYSEIQATKQR